MGPEPASPARPFDLRTGERLLKDLRQEAARADTKSSVLVGAHGMVAAVLVGVLSAHGWHPGVLTALGQSLWWTGAACILVSLSALLMAVTPRYGAREWRPGMPITHFADIRSAAGRGPTALETALRDTERAPEATILIALTENSRIVAGKYQSLRVGTACFVAALILLPGSLLAA
ncbi:Pycsar system effector family protein [Embleya sp. NPDC005575]|uniref:Pycsar system effector family protein n=1 Tax=Embleya sp. NPDC005575 TaxID=3156892 RepID=UPI0033ACC611